MPGPEQSAFERLGGEPALRAIIGRLVDRMFDDVMIGFLFARANRERIKDKEYELAAELLGANVCYSGRPLREAHARHAIQGGQFMRRFAILRTVLTEHGVPEDIRARWLEHTESLRAEITADVGGECRAPTPHQPAGDAPLRGPEGS